MQLTNTQMAPWQFGFMMRTRQQEAIKQVNSIRRLSLNVCMLAVSSSALADVPRYKRSYKILQALAFYHGSSSKVGRRRVWNKATNVADDPTHNYSIYHAIQSNHVYTCTHAHAHTSWTASLHMNPRRVSHFHFYENLVAANLGMRFALWQLRAAMRNS